MAMTYWEDRDNAIVNKSKAFAVRIVKLYQYLTGNHIEFNIANQLIRSGTSIGANVREAERGQSGPDFYTKMNIALKEADETAYWLELLFEGNYITQTMFDSIYQDCEELIRMLVTILKKNYKKGKEE